MKSPRELLQEALSERMASNPSYSMRAFARDIALSSQQLSNVLSGQRGISSEMAEKISKRLSMSSQQKDLFCWGAIAHHSRSPSQRAVAKAKLEHLSQSALQTAYFDLDILKTISNWYHFAILELIKIKRPANQKTINCITYFSSSLGIPETETELALARLERLGLISKSGKNWKLNQDVAVIDQGIPSEGVKTFHRQILEKATRALAFQNQEERYGYSWMMPVKVKNIHRAKKLIRKFKDEFSKELAEQHEGEEIYGVSVQYFKMSELQKENEKV